MDRLYDFFSPMRVSLLRFNEALGEFGKIEVAGPYPVGKYQHATATITAPNGRVVSWEFVLSESGVSYQRTPYQLSEYSRLEFATKKRCCLVPRESPSDANRLPQSAYLKRPTRFSLCIWWHSISIGSDRSRKKAKWGNDD